jgi:hypothetical protein
MQPSNWTASRGAPMVGVRAGGPAQQPIMSRRTRSAEACRRTTSRRSSPAGLAGS